MTEYIATFLVLPAGGVVRLPADNAGTRADKFLQWSADGLTLENTVLTDGADGADGVDGVDGADGLGVPAGGTTRQVLAKIDATNNNTSWTDLALGDLTDITETSDRIEIAKGFRPGLYDHTGSPPLGTVFESSVDGHLYWCHRDGSVHQLCYGSPEY